MQIISFKSKIYIQPEIETRLMEVLDEWKPRKIFILADENTYYHCLPHFDRLMSRHQHYVLRIGQGESEKSIKTVTTIWQFLQKHKADRESVLINLGGGMLLDIGGFAASTFKRGVKFINIPTTLLSMVDASVGGKTGLNFNDYKNHVGTFSQPGYVLISPAFLKTLDKRQIYAGWAEMLKHGLIRSRAHLDKLLKLSPGEVDEEALTGLISESVQIKNYYVQEDPYEQNLRKVLNFGHTIGHGLESIAFSARQKLLHGEAVANGMICEMFLSEKFYNPGHDIIQQMREYILQHYPTMRLSEKKMDAFFHFLLQDKKNEGNEINFTLIREIGEPITDQYISRKDIEEALRYYMELNMERS